MSGAETETAELTPEGRLPPIGRIAANSRNGQGSRRAVLVNLLLYFANGYTTNANEAA
jgi:hypothetical protein